MTPHRTASRSRKTPTATRILLLVALLGASDVAIAEPLATPVTEPLATPVTEPLAPPVTEPVTEAAVIRLARQNDPALLAAQASIALAEADELGASLREAPALAWDREHLPVGEPATVDTFSLTVPLDLSGRRPAERALARAATASARAHAARTGSDSITRALAAFYAALAAERDVSLFARSVARLDEALRVVAHRRDAGATAGYEATRLELEAELARSEHHEAEARSRAARATLVTLLGVDATTLVLRGDFTTTAPLAAATTPDDRPSLRFQRAAEAAASAAGTSAASAWGPTLSLSGGLRTGETTERRVGYVAGLAISLPIFSRGPALVAEAAARARRAAAERGVAERDARIDEHFASEQLTSARAELVRFIAATTDRVELLERAAQSGYREGHLTLLEFVDAQRSRTEVERRRLELELLAKRAELVLRAARGEFE